MPGCLVSSDQEDFTYYENEYNEKMMFLYTRDLGCLLRIRPLGWNPGGGGGGNNLGNLFTKCFDSHDLYVREK